MVIGNSVNKALKKSVLKSLNSGNGGDFGGGLSTRSNMICHKCGKKGHFWKDCRSKGNGSNGNPPQKSTNELPLWVTKKHIVSDTKYM